VTLDRLNPLIDVTVLPRVSVVVPTITLLFAKYPLGKAVETLVMATLARVRLLMVAMVSPSTTAVLPIVMAVEKLLSSCDRGKEPVAVEKVYGTAI
jgi:hypothetical protein